MCLKTLAKKVRPPLYENLAGTSIGYKIFNAGVYPYGMRFYGLYHKSEYKIGETCEAIDMEISNIDHHMRISKKEPFGFHVYLSYEDAIKKWKTIYLGSDLTEVAIVEVLFEIPDIKAHGLTDEGDEDFTVIVGKMTLVRMVKLS